MIKPAGSIDNRNLLQTHLMLVQSENIALSSFSLFRKGDKREIFLFSSNQIHTNFNFADLLLVRGKIHLSPPFIKGGDWLFSISHYYSSIIAFVLEFVWLLFPVTRCLFVSWFLFLINTFV
jgi:hypothetical protein